MIDKNKIVKLIENHQAGIFGNPRKASVMLLLIEIEGEWHIIFEVRGNSISQPGETSFPGGGIEIGETKEEAAIRETVEELGVKPDNIEIIGEIDFTASENHVVYCFVGILNNTELADLKPDKHEVDDVFTVPLNYFLTNQPEYFDIPIKVDPEADFPFHLIKGGIKYPFYAFDRKVPFYCLPKEVAEYTLWGFTAGFVDNFINIIKNKN
ncbi:MAG: CoA pyrophosphatase [Clostridiaceae bacterium]|nr:CoA pyrophosphatase [Clostridiaceae bacterium]